MHAPLSSGECSRPRPRPLWQAITDRAHLRGWFIEPRGDLRLGGTFALEGHAHGRILRCDPPRMLRVTWVYGPRHADELEVRLTKGEGGGTVIELEHASIADTAPDGVTDALLGVGVGWELAMAHLGRHLDGEMPLPPADGSGSVAPANSRGPAADGRERACVDGAARHAGLTRRAGQPARRAACVSR